MSTPTINELKSSMQEKAEEIAGLKNEIVSLKAMVAKYKDLVESFEGANAPAQAKKRKIQYVYCDFCKSKYCYCGAQACDKCCCYDCDCVEK